MAVGTADVLSVVMDRSLSALPGVSAVLAAVLLKNLAFAKNRVRARL